MRLSGFLFCFVLRLSVCTSQGCSRPCALDGALFCQFVRLSSAGVSHKTSLQPSFLLHPLPHPRDIWLTQRFNPLQSP